MDRIGDPDRRARRAGPGGGQAFRDQAAAPAEVGVAGDRVESRVVVDLGATLARRHHGGAPRGRGAIRDAHPGASATRSAWTAGLAGGSAHAWNNKALLGFRGRRAQGSKRATARRWHERLTWLAARSCSTRW